MQTVHEKIPDSRRPAVTFDWTPKSTAFTVTAGGNVYPWTLNQPATGAPDQPDLFTTNTNVELTFTATVQTFANDFITEYFWDFGDGVEAYGQTATHTYRSASPQTRATLCVTDNHRRRICVGRQVQLIPSQPITVSQAIVVQPA